MRACLHDGDWAGVRAAERGLVQLLGVAEYANRHAHHDLYTSWLCIMVGHPEFAAEWVKQDALDDAAAPPGGTAPPGGAAPCGGPGAYNALFSGFEDLVRARYLLATRRHHRLLALARSQDNSYGACGFLFGKVTFKVFEAVALYRTGARQEAFAALARAYALSRANGIDMPFIESGNDMRALGGAALLAREAGTGGAVGGVPGDWLRRVVRRSATFVKRLAYAGAEFRKARNLSSGVRLSPRESQLLADLCQGLSRMEIAESRRMSVNTVKSTLQMIYAKLGAENNVDAVRIALSRGLVPE
jgi:DNA-binding CsgD family transcriptional regulator